MVPEEKRKVRVVARILGEGGGEDQVFFATPQVVTEKEIESSADVLRKANNLQMEVTNGKGGTLVLNEGVLKRTLFFIENLD